MTNPASPESPPPPASETRFVVLLFTDIVGSADLKARHGVPAYSAALRIHNDHFERVIRECRGIRILQNMGDGYFAEAGSVSEAVRFALLFQDAMRAGPWGEIRLTTRVGIHAGEVTALVAEGGSGIVAPAVDLAARVMSLAVGGQILLTRFPFDETRHFVREHPAVAGKDAPPLRWLAHGPYLLKGRDEPMEIFEVGAEGLAPLAPPPDGEKAKRAVRPGEEETLGWRPAIGLEIPGRAGWRLTALLGKGGFGEVWTGEHAKLRQRRAFKFCFDDARLRALKREVTLVRLLRTALGDRDDIVRFHELKLDEPPFYLESDLAPHGNLLQWAEKQGGLAAIPLAQRIALVAHTATALAAAHSIGVLHKDIKPTNILIFDAPDGTVRPRLVDFGIGTLADPAVLGQHGVTAAGFTRATIERSTGTPTYSPPEYLAGKPYTVQGDIYGLGVLLYQLITTDSSRPIAPGWERDIIDPLLREDIAACVDGDPSRRLPSAADLADRLLHLDQRRAEIAEKERLTREAGARVQAEAAAVVARIRAARLRKLAGAFALLALFAIAGGMMAWVNKRKADAARTEVIQQKAEVERMNTEYQLMLTKAGWIIFETPRPANGFIAKVTSFVGDHPEFRLIADRLREKNTLKFNHKRHLVETNDIPLINGQRLKCAFCHEPVSGGAFFQRISYDRNCEICHIPMLDEYLQLPHERVQDVRAFLRLLPLYYADLARRGGTNRQADVDEFVRTRLQLLQVAFGNGTNLDQAVFFGRRRTNQGRTVFDGCAMCHEVRVGSFDAPVITRPVQPDSWMALAHFNHAKHANVTCLKCHDALKSSDTADVIMPAKADCVKCHSPNAVKGPAPSDCSVCHSDRIPMATPAQPGTR